MVSFMLCIFHHNLETNCGSLTDEETFNTAAANRPLPQASVTHRLEHRLGQKAGRGFADVTLASHLTQDVAIQVSGLERDPRYHEGLRSDKAKVSLLSLDGNVPPTPSGGGSGLHLT